MPEARLGLLNAVVPLVPICVKLVQPEPLHRSTRYSVTPTLSVEPVQLRSSWVLPTSVVESPLGVDGAEVSGGSGVVAVAIAE